MSEREPAGRLWAQEPNTATSVPPPGMAGGAGSAQQLPGAPPVAGTTGGYRTVEAPGFGSAPPAPPASDSRRGPLLAGLALVSGVAVALVLVLLISGGGPSAALKTARAINLRLADLPGYRIETDNSASDQSSDDQFDQQMSRCIGAAAGSDPGEVDASSPLFGGGDGLGASAIMSSVSIEQSAAISARELRRFSTGQARGCLVQALDGVSVPGGSGQTVRYQDMRASILRDVAPGAIAIRLSGQIASSGVAVPVFFDFTLRTVGRDELALMTLGVSQPVPAEVEGRLSALLAARAIDSPH